MLVYAVMALLYEWVHFLTHTAYVARSSFYRKIWRNHRLHHFKNEHFWYSFVLPQVDEWMGTGPRVSKVETSSTCRTLGVEKDLGVSRTKA